MCTNDGGGNKEIKLSVVVGQSKQVVRQLTVSAKVNKTKNYMLYIICGVGCGEGGSIL